MPFLSIGVSIAGSRGGRDGSINLRIVATSRRGRKLAEKENTFRWSKKKEKNKEEEFVRVWSVDSSVILSTGLYLRSFVKNRGQKRGNLQLGETERRVYSNVLLG